MLLLSAVAVHAADLLVAHSERRLLEALLPPSSGSALLSLELMAQAAAAYAGLASAATGNSGSGASAAAAAPGMLLGSRTLRVHAQVPLRARLLVGVVRRTPLTGGGLAKFAGQVWSGSDDALQQALETAEALAGTAAGEDIVEAVDRCTGVDCLAAADVSVYLPTGAS